MGRLIFSPYFPQFMYDSLRVQALFKDFVSNLVKILILLAWTVKPDGYVVINLSYLWFLVPSSFCCLQILFCPCKLRYLFDEMGLLYFIWHYSLLWNRQLSGHLLFLTAENGSVSSCSNFFVVEDRHWKPFMLGVGSDICW